MPDLGVDKNLLLRCVEISKEIAKDIKTIKSEMGNQGNTTPLASKLFLNLKALSSNFFTLYFKVKRNRFQTQSLGE
jgi:hypothetical protein